MFIAFCSFLKPLGRTAIGFDFWHFKLRIVSFLNVIVIYDTVMPFIHHCITIGSGGCLFTLLFTIRGQHHGQLAAFHLWMYLHCAYFRKILFDTLQ